MVKHLAQVYDPDMEQPRSLRLIKRLSVVAALIGGVLIVVNGIAMSMSLHSGPTGFFVAAVAVFALAFILMVVYLAVDALIDAILRRDVMAVEAAEVE